jgi:hypothetical protein
LFLDKHEAGQSGSISVEVDGTSHELTRAEADQRLRGVRAESSARHGVLVNETWYPVKQAFEVALGVPRTQFTSDTARRYLAELGYPLRGQAERRDPAGAAPRQEPAAVWPSREHVRTMLVTGLTTTGWRIRAGAERDRGIDVVAEREGQQVGIGVQGYPAGAAAQPGTQAGFWYGQAVLAAMRLRTRWPELGSVIALPDLPRYRGLVSDTWSSLDAARIALWWVGQDGTVQPHGAAVPVGIVADSAELGT